MPKRTKKREATKTQSNTIAQWLGKPQPKQKQEEEQPDKKAKPSRKRPAQKKPTLQRSDSFEKYGIVFPTVEEILQQRRENQLFKERVEALSTNVNNFLNSLHNEEERAKPPPKKPRLKILNCNHLTDDQLRAYFYKHLDYLKEIFEGKRYHERHERYHNPKIVPKRLLDGLTCSPCSFVFTPDQQSDLVSLMEKEIDESETRYFFQVLLHILCLKIFCDVYNKQEDEGLEYLYEQPLEGEADEDSD